MHCNRRLPVPFDEPETLEATNAPVNAKGLEGADGVGPGAGLTTAPLHAAFARQSADLGRCQALIPDWGPELALARFGLGC